MFQRLFARFKAKPKPVRVYRQTPRMRVCYHCGYVLTGYPKTMREASIGIGWEWKDWCPRCGCVTHFRAWFEEKA